MAAANPDAMRSFTVVIDANTEYSCTGLNVSSATMRHLFQGGLGQRYTANLIARTDRFVDADGKTVPETSVGDRMTGLLCLVGSTEYRVMTANATPCGGLVRLALDSADQVGV